MWSSFFCLKSYKVLTVAPPPRTVEMALQFALEMDLDDDGGGVGPP